MFTIKPLDKQTSKSSVKNIPQHPFTLLINSSKGGGKTTLLLNLLSFYKKLFDRIIIFSPTVLLDEKWLSFINSNELLKPKKSLKKQTIFFTQTVENKQNLNIHEIYTDYSNSVMENLRESQGKKVQDILIIFEDSLGLKNVYKQNSLVMKYLPNSRHLKTSMIFVSQNYKSIPRVIRNNNSGLIFFETPNDKELKMIYEENSCFLNYEDWKTIYDYIMKDNYNFMFINYQNSKCFNILKNFEKVIRLT